MVSDGFLEVGRWTYQDEQHTRRNGQKIGLERAEAQALEREGKVRADRSRCDERRQADQVENPQVVVEEGSRDVFEG